MVTIDARYLVISSPSSSPGQEIVLDRGKVMVFIPSLRVRACGVAMGVRSTTWEPKRVVRNWLAFPVKSKNRP
jgi:hypothetical protein